MIIAHLIFQIQTIFLALLDGLSQKARIAGFNEMFLFKATVKLLVVLKTMQ